MPIIQSDGKQCNAGQRLERWRSADVMDDPSEVDLVLFDIIGVSHGLDASGPALFFLIGLKH